ncbi:hypothetical protein [Kitasatospora griseola]|uniref:hypothetical protein n=1 Tax=Kitasatospora griseola TaxID=2064 RepID=UPI003800B84B
MTITPRADYWDAIAIDTNSTGLTVGREWDGPTSSSFTLYVTSSAYSGNGDYVCQDGYASGIICNIKVTDDDVIWTGANGIDHRGVKGVQVDGGVAVRKGDSGGLVFANTGTTRQARGLVSGIGSGGSSNTPSFCQRAKQA